MVLKADIIKKVKKYKKGLLMIFYQKQTFCIMDFSLLSPLEFFVVPKNGDGRNNKPPAIDMIPLK